MTSLNKMLSMLDLFTPETPVVSADEAAARLQYSRTTAYRYLRALCDAGLLSRLSGVYTLGPRAIEIDYVIRSADPLLQASEPVMSAIRDRYGCNVQLFSMFSDRIIAVHHVLGADPVAVSFGRGRATPMFLGAGGRAIVASLPTARSRALFEQHQDEAKAGGLGDDWQTARNRLKTIRNEGSVISVGELDRDSVGIAAPIPLTAPALPSSLVMVLSRQRYELIDRKAAVEVVRDGAARILAALQAYDEPTIAMDKPRRAVALKAAPKAGKTTARDQRSK